MFRQISRAGLLRTLAATDPALRFRVAMALDPRKQYVIAAAAGINPAIVNRYVNGRAVASAHKQPLAEVLGVPQSILWPVTAA